MTPRRIKRAAIAVAESTLLDLHRALVARKYRRLYGNSAKRRPGRKGPSNELIKLVVETKERNPSYGCPKIAMLIANVTGEKVDEETVRRILKKHYRPTPGKGPSWLVPIGDVPGRLWSLDLFRVESAGFCGRGSDRRPAIYGRGARHATPAIYRQNRRGQIFRPQKTIITGSYTSTLAICPPYGQFPTAVASA